MQRRYTQEEKDFLMNFIPGHSYREIAEEFSRRFWPMTINQVNAFCNYYHIRTGHGIFRKGRKMSVKEQSPATQFKPGHMPHNTLPIGTERISCGYVEVKTANPNIWERKHKLIWEQCNGKLPEGWIVVFRDGDKTNLNPDNLDAIPKSVSVTMNRMGLLKENKNYYEPAKLIAMIELECNKKK